MEGVGKVLSGKLRREERKETGEWKILGEEKKVERGDEETRKETEIEEINEE